MSFKIFGWEINKLKEFDNSKHTQSIVQDNDDGSSVVDVTDYPQNMIHSAFGLSFDEEFKDAKTRIEFYRQMTTNPYIDECVDDIVNEAISKDDNNDIVDIVVDDTEFSASIKKRIVEEFNDLLALLEFDIEGSDLFRQWYIDGVSYYHLIVDSKSPKDGITGIRKMDPRKTKKVAEIKTDEDGVETSRREYYVYLPFEEMEDDANKRKNPRHVNRVSGGDASYMVQIPKDAVSMAWSGLRNKKGEIISYLDRAIQAYNQLAGLESAMLVFYISRAPEKRQFLVEVGDVSKQRGEQYIQKLADKYKNKTVYDTQTGEIRNNSQITTMFQDYWLPQKNGKGTSISNIGSTMGGQFDIEEILKPFLKKLYKAMKVPYSRYGEDGGGFMGSRSSEISRDEIKFFKYVQKVRSRFSEMFLDILKKQLLLKKVITPEEWDKEGRKINFSYSEDSLFYEFKQSEMLEMRMNVLNAVDPFVGKYFSQEWVEKNILKMSEEDIKEMIVQKDEEAKEAAKKNEEDPQGGFGGGFGGDDEDGGGEAEDKQPAPEPAEKKKPFGGNE